jgi:hypothetical protein
MTMLSYLLWQHDQANRCAGLAYSYPFRRRVPVFWTLREGCTVDNDDLPSTANAFKNAEGCIFIAALWHLIKSPGGFSALLSDHQIRVSLYPFW